MGFARFHLHRSCVLLLILHWCIANCNASAILVTGGEQGPGSEPGRTGPVLVFEYDGTGPLVSLPDIPSSITQAYPYGAAFNANGELFTGNRYANIDIQGSISRFVQTTPGTFVFNGSITGNGLNKVHSVTFSPDGELFATNWDTFEVSRFVFDGSGNAISNGTIPIPNVAWMHGVAFSDSGELFVAQYNLISRFLFDPMTSAAIPNGSFSIAPGSFLASLSFSPSGELFVPDPHNDIIYRFTFDGTGLPVSNGTISVFRPTSVTFDAFTGELFVGSNGEYNIGPSGIFRFTFDTNGNAVPNGHVVTSPVGQLAIWQVTDPLPHAPVQETTHTDASLTRIGTSSTLPPGVTIQNNGDGNLSGLGAASNLNGSIDTGTDGRFVGGGSSFSLPDHTSTSVPITYSPTTHSVDTSTFNVDYSNGSSNGLNQPESVQVVISGQGVGPTYESNPTPGSTLDFGGVVIGDSSNLPFSITNSSTDPNGGDSTLTDLTLLSAVISGPDAAEFNLVGFTPGTVLNQQDLINLLIEFSPGFGPGSKDATLTFLTDEGAAFGSPGLSFSYSLQGAATPEPASMLGFAVVGLVGVLMWRRKRPMSKHYQ